MNIQAGTILGKYKVEGMLGNGGMATVYKAVHQSLDRNVALKVLHAHLTAEELIRERFLLEAQAIASLKHPNIVHVYDYEASDEISFISMEYFDGGALDQQLETRRIEKGRFKPLPIKQALNIGLDIAEALDFAHQQGIIHRDVKPANILIGTDGRYVLTDFGLATLLHQNRMTTEGATSGTPTYIPPEMVIGERGDERSDIYSLGIVMFELLTGELPFDSENLYGMLMQHINQPVPSLSDLNPLVTDDVSRIVFRALEKKADDRFQSGAEFAEAIRQVLESLDSLDQPETDRLVVNPIYGNDFEYQSGMTLNDLPEAGTGVFQVMQWGWQRITLAAIVIGVLLTGSFFLLRWGSSTTLSPVQFTPFVESFDSNDVGWPIDGAPEWTQLTDGTYEMRIETPNRVISVVPSDGATYEQFKYSAEIVQLDGPSETGYGLVFYYQDPLNYHVFGINGFGQWSIWQLQDGVWQALHHSDSGEAWINSDSIFLINQLNILRVEAGPSEIDLFANDQFLANVPLSDNLLKEGAIGFYLATSPEETVVSSIVEFDNVVVTP